MNQSAPDPTQRFSSRVTYYVQSRPRYPAALLQFCRERLGLLPGHAIADVGSGTGFLSELFVGNGNRVFAVEPNLEMRSAAENLLAGRENFISRDGTAEQTGLDAASVDFVTAGQAFHWFDRPRARKEFSRILRPGGWMILIWNDRKTEAGFSDEYERIVAEFETDLKHVSHRAITATDSKTMGDFFAPGHYEMAAFENPQKLDLEGLIARALSSSYLPLPGQPGCQEMIRRLGELFAAHQKNGQIVQPYETKAYYGQVASAEMS